MDEMGAQALMKRMSVTEPPPSRVDIALARQQGARRLRRRRWAAGVVPLLAAATIAAVIAGTGALSRAAGPGRGGVRPVSPVQLPPYRFDPLVPYASFGWLPKGVPVAASGASSMPAQLTLVTGNLTVGQFGLTVWAPGTCNLTAAQVIKALGGKRHPELDCTQSVSAGWAGQALRRAPTVRGRTAFWLRGKTLAWEYAPRAWATLVAYHHPAFAPATLVKVAAGIRYATTTAPSVRFPYQLTGIPASWRVTSAHWHPSRNGPLGKGLDAGPIGQLDVTRGHSGCWFDPGASQRITLDGVKAVYTLFRQKGVRSYQGLCVPEVDGLSLSFLLFRAPGSHSYPLGGVTGIFLHHLRLLGPDPANWTTHPLG